jgi:hypothetical protein
MMTDPLPRDQVKVALLVMGVGRSGTSALTRVLNLLGAALPAKTLAANSGNERGYWEPSSILALSEEILSVHGSDWHDPRSFPKEWFASSEAAVFIDRAKTIIEDDYDGASLIVIKEPRICRLAPIYLAALDRAGYASRVVIPLRHPSEVAGSLKQRDGTDELTSELIWIRHMLEMEAATRHCPRVWMTYDQLLEDWWSVQATIALALNVTWLNPAKAVAPEINAFLAPTLRHFDAKREPVPQKLGPITSRIWQTAQAGLTGDEATLREGFDGMRAIMDEIDRLGASQVAKERAEKIVIDKLRQTAAEAAATTLAAREAAETTVTIERQAREAAETAMTIERQARESAEARVTTLEQQMCEIQGQAAADAAQAATNAQQLEAQLAKQRQCMSDLHASVSWRVTGPLRSAMGMFRSRPRH